MRSARSLASLPELQKKNVSIEEGSVVSSLETYAVLLG
jgi:hypothetical protein